MASEKKAIVRVGITGVTGKIGRTLTEGLIDKYELSLFGHRTEIEQKSHRKLPFVKVDISRPEQLKDIFQGLDAVIHLAADSRSRAPWEDILDKNIMGTYNVFEEAKHSGVRRIVFASSNHALQGHSMLDHPTSIDPSFVARNGLIKLSDPPAPASYYGVSKLFGENLGYYYWRLFGIEVVALRIGSTFDGDDPSIPRDKVSEDYMKAMFLSKRDCVHVFDRALRVDAGFLVAYAISNNDQRVYDLTETRATLGFEPQDNSAAYFHD